MVVPAVLGVETRFAMTPTTDRHREARGARYCPPGECTHCDRDRLASPAGPEEPREGLRETAFGDVLLRWSRKAKDAAAIGGDFHAGAASAFREAMRDLRSLAALATTPAPDTSHSPCDERCACYQRGHDQGFEDGHD
jgi:hypothetical protein